MPNNNFYTLLIGFVAIVAAAFGLLIWVSHEPKSVDTPTWSM